MIPAEAVEAAAKAIVAALDADSASLVVVAAADDVTIDAPGFDLVSAARAALEAAAPYMQRTITTEAELDALPVGSIVAMIGSEPDAPAVACRAVLGWQFLGGDPERRYQSSALMPSPEPITVLHEAPNAR